MRYSLLTYVCCPVCRGALACFVAREVETESSPFVAERADRAPVAGASFAPSPRFRTSTPLAARLTALGGAAAPPRNRVAAIDSGLLICGDCGRWFPIVGTLPELLPDHLRDAARERPLFDTLAATLPGDVRSMLLAPVYESPSVEDAGAHYKRAEISVASKVEDPYRFFGPGYSAPFNPGNTEFSLYLISLFGNVVRLLGVDGKTSQSGVVVDSGCGYAWTTEWMAKSGLEAIGVDITRTYLEIAVNRMGHTRPHLIVCDVENLPIAGACAHAVLAFESFHHLPDRPAAFAGYARALRDDGVVVLAEPGGAHEQADVSIDTMRRFGILEKGMEIEDVEDYVAGKPFAPPEKLFVLHLSRTDLERGISLPEAWRYSLFDGHVFRIRKDASRVAARSPSRASGSGSPRERVAAAIVDDRGVQMGMRHPWEAELERTIRELHAVRVQLHDTEIELTLARRAIAAMQRSAFWRARAVWVWVASLFGSERGRVPASFSRASDGQRATDASASGAASATHQRDGQE